MTVIITLLKITFFFVNRNYMIVLCSICPVPYHDFHLGLFPPAVVDPAAVGIAVTLCWYVVYLVVCLCICAIV